MTRTCETLTVLDLVPFGQTERETRFFALRLSHPGWESWHPGQFVMLRPQTFGVAHLWGRPFSICHMTSRFLTCFFKVEGRGTSQMARLKRGDKIDAWGPLGNYFSMDAEAPTLLLAGGMGIAPFVGYAVRHPAPENIAMLFGHREPLGCYPLDTLTERIAVEDFKENSASDLPDFISLLRAKVSRYAAANGLVLACGPRPFLKTVQNLARENNVRCQLSLETRMACGVGACLGCVCKSSDEWPEDARKNWPVRVCVEGPVFWANTIDI